MAALSAGERAELLKAFSADLSGTRTPFNLSRADLLAAINAADDWADANASSFNSALPLPARTTLSAKQKAAILMFVIRRRFEVA